MIKKFVFSLCVTSMLVDIQSPYAHAKMAVSESDPSQGRILRRLTRQDKIARRNALKIVRRKANLEKRPRRVRKKVRVKKSHLRKRGRPSKRRAMRARRSKSITPVQIRPHVQLPVPLLELREEMRIPSHQVVGPIAPHEENNGRRGGATELPLLNNHEIGFEENTLIPPILEQRFAELQSARTEDQLQEEVAPERQTLPLEVRLEREQLEDQGRVRREEERRQEVQRRIEEERTQQERVAEQRRLEEEQIRAEEARRQEERRQTQLQQEREEERIRQERVRLEAELRRLEQEQIRAEEVRRQEERRQAQLQQEREEERIRQERVRLEAELRRLEQEQIRVEEARQQEERRQAQLQQEREEERVRQERLRQEALQVQRRQEEQRLENERQAQLHREHEEAEVPAPAAQQERIGQEAEQRRVADEQVRAEEAHQQETVVSESQAIPLVGEHEEEAPQQEERRRIQPQHEHEQAQQHIEETIARKKALKLAKEISRLKNQKPVRKALDRQRVIEQQQFEEELGRQRGIEQHEFYEEQIASIQTALHSQDQLKNESAQEEPHLNKSRKDFDDEESLKMELREEKIKAAASLKLRKTQQILEWLSLLELNKPSEEINEIKSDLIRKLYSIREWFNKQRRKEKNRKKAPHTLSIHASYRLSSDLSSDPMKVPAPRFKAVPQPMPSAAPASFLKEGPGSQILIPYPGNQPKMATPVTPSIDASYRLASNLPSDPIQMPTPKFNVSIETTMRAASNPPSLKLEQQSAPLTSSALGKNPSQQVVLYQPRKSQKEFPLEYFIDVDLDAHQGIRLDGFNFPVPPTATENVSLVPFAHKFDAPEKDVIPEFSSDSKMNQREIIFYDSISEERMARIITSLEGREKKNHSYTIVDLSKLCSDAGASLGGFINKIIKTFDPIIKDTASKIVFDLRLLSPSSSELISELYADSNVEMRDQSATPLPTSGGFSTNRFHESTDDVDDYSADGFGSPSKTDNSANAVDDYSTDGFGSPSSVSDQLSPNGFGSPPSASKDNAPRTDFDSSVIEDVSLDKGYDHRPRGFGSPLKTKDSPNEAHDYSSGGFGSPSPVSEDQLSPNGFGSPSPVSEDTLSPKRKRGFTSSKKSGVKLFGDSIKDSPTSSPLRNISNTQPKGSESPKLQNPKVNPTRSKIDKEN